MKKFWFNTGMVFTSFAFTAECITADSFTSHPSARAGKLRESKMCNQNRCNHEGRAFHSSSVRSIVFFMESTKGWQVVREKSRQWAQRSRFKWVNHVVPIIPDNHCVFCVATDDYVNISCNNSRNISRLSLLLCCQVWFQKDETSYLRSILYLFLLLLLLLLRGLTFTALF